MPINLRLTVLFAAACLAAILAACSSNPLLPSEIRMTTAELTQHLAKRFPVERSVAGLVDVTFMHPVMSVNDAEKSLVATFDMTVRVPLSTKRLNGSVAVSGTPEYVPQSRSLFLKGGKVDRLAIDNMPEALSGALAKVASQLAKSQFEDKPLYTFQPEDFTTYGAGYEPVRIQMRGDALVLTLRP
jgi:hypothetical protein